MKSKTDKDFSILNELEVAERLARLNLGWSIDEDMLVREFEFEDYDAVIVFVNKVADRARQLGHHPDVQFSYNRVVVKIITHKVDSITDLDFKLAGKIDGITA
jgi:4a-hydroxytetrahydrobiopterin dehydratase